MADLILATSTYAVGTADSASTIVNNVTAQDAQHINGPVSAILQIESVLGNAPDLVGSEADLASRLAVSLNPDGTLIQSEAVFEVGDICASMRTSKTGWLLMSGDERSNTTYEALLDQLISRLSTTTAYALRTGTGIDCTVDHTLDQFTATAHGLVNNQVVYFRASSTPSGMSVLTKYYVVNKTANTFQVSTTVGGAALALSSNGSGVVVHSTFVADVRGTALVGADNMGGSSRNKATDAAADVVGGGAGSESGVATHSHGVTDPGHTHPKGFNIGDGSFFKTSDSGAGGTPASQVTGISINNAGTSTGNMMPYTTVNYFIKY
jgi:hypothetical protein